MALVGTAAADTLPGQPEAAPAAGAPAVMAPLPAASSVTQQAPERPLFAKNALYAEVAGNAGFYSINYERFLRPDAAIRAGLMYMSIDVMAGSAESKGSWMAIPVMFDYLGLHAGNHALELGGGLSFMYFSGKASTFDASASSSGMIPVGTATLGYRYSDPHGGFVFRVGYTPLVFFTTDTKQVQHWGGMSFGYRFGG